MRRRSLQRGTAAVELALLLPMLLMLTFMVAECGRALMQYNTLAKSVRDAARYLSVQTPGTRVAEARNLVVYGNTAGEGSPLVAGLTPANVPPPTWQAVGAAPAIPVVTVQVTGFRFTPMVRSVFGLAIGPFAFGPIAATMRSPG
ncbi:MAG TPA: TadE/TadG family type IV pilus assembly protein [Ramlibacter sp.]